MEEQVKEDFDEKRDYRNYDPLKVRTPPHAIMYFSPLSQQQPRQRFGNYPSRNRALPVKHWLGEQAIYGVREGARIPEVERYGRDDEVLKYVARKKKK